MVVGQSLDLNLLDFAVGFHQLVSDLQQHAEREVGLLNAGQDFGLVDVFAGDQRVNVIVGGQLHLVDVFDLIEQQVGKLVAAVGGL